MADDDFGVAGAWSAFCARVGDLGGRLGREPFPPTEADRALCVRHVARQVVMALQAELEFGDAANPLFHRYEEPWVQWGGPNPDNVYTRAAIDPMSTYRVTGNVTGVRAALFSLVDGDMHLGRYGVFSECTLADLEVESDGSLEVWISPERPADAGRDRNWISSHADARMFLVRQYLCDWEHDRAATLTIERVETRGLPPVPLLPPEFEAALDRAATWVERSVEYWCSYVERARETLPLNAVAPPSTPRGGAPTIAYSAGWWRLGPGECLLITTDVPDADYWGWTLHHRYRLDSGDFAARSTSVNMAQVVADADGRMRLVVGAADPGVPNWIDTEDEPEGMLVYRSIGTRSRPVPDARVVAIAELREQLPDSHPAVDAEQRRVQLARRRAGVLSRYV
jgi:hypothetical protein